MFTFFVISLLSLCEISNSWIIGHTLCHFRGKISLPRRCDRNEIAFHAFRSLNTIRLSLSLSRQYRGNVGNNESGKFVSNRRARQESSNLVRIHAIYSVRLMHTPTVHNSSERSSMYRFVMSRSGVQPREGSLFYFSNGTSYRTGFRPSCFVSSRCLYFLSFIYLVHISFVSHRYRTQTIPGFRSAITSLFLFFYFFLHKEPFRGLEFRVIPAGGFFPPDDFIHVEAAE